MKIERRINYFKMDNFNVHWQDEKIAICCILYQLKFVNILTV